MKRTNSLREMRESSDDELNSRLKRLEEELFRLRLKRATNQLENTMQIRHTRREIACVYTILTERRRNQSAPSAQT